MIPPRLLAGVLAIIVGVGGCGGNQMRQQAPISELESRDRSARLAFEKGQHAQAVTLYEAVLQAALAEDKPAAIIDARFNLALCLMNLGNYEAALTQTDQAEAERQRRALPVDPDMQLLVGTIHYRAGDLERAQDTLSAVFRPRAADTAIRAKAHFVAGLIAADRAALPVLRNHIAALEAIGGTDVNADHMELQGRLLGLEDNIDGALLLLDQAVVLRSIERDYRGMVRALAAAGGLAEKAGRLQPAANYLLRAGRSAAQRNEPDAQDWLRRAMQLGQSSGDFVLVQEAEIILRDIEAGN